MQFAAPGWGVGARGCAGLPPLPLMRLFKGPPSSPHPSSQSPAFTQLTGLDSGLFCHVDEMLCSKGKLYSVNIYSEKWFAVLPPWSAWPRMKAWYKRLPAWTGSGAFCSIYFQLLWGSFSGNMSASCLKPQSAGWTEPCPPRLVDAWVWRRVESDSTRGSVTKWSCSWLSAQFQGDTWEERGCSGPRMLRVRREWTCVLATRTMNSEDVPICRHWYMLPWLWHFLSLPDFLQTQLQIDYVQVLTLGTWNSDLIWK